MKWTFEAQRELINQKELSRTIKKYRGAGHDLAVLKRAGKKISIAFASTEKRDQFDFATELSLSKFIDSKNTIYIEAMDDGYAVFVELDDKLPKRSRLMPKESIEQELRWLESEKTLPKKLLVSGQFELGNLKAKDSDTNIQFLDEPLSEVLNASS